MAVPPRGPILRGVTLHDGVLREWQRHTTALGCAAFAYHCATLSNVTDHHVL